MAVRAGGEGDVTKTRLLWRGTERSRIGTPVVDRGRIYWFNSRTANCIDAATGKQVYQVRVGVGAAEAPGPAGPGPRQPGPGKAEPGKAGPGGPARKPGGGFGGRGGAMMRSMDYASPVLAGGKIYFLARSGDAFVYAAGPQFKLLGQNRFAADGGDFSSTPAVSDGQLFIRSSKYLYCVAEPTRSQ